MLAGRLRRHKGRINKMIEIIRLLIQDIKNSYKIFIVYTIEQIILSWFSRIGNFYLNKNFGSEQVKGIFFTLLSFLIISMQYFIYISFLSSYVKTSKINCEFTNEGKGYFQTIKIIVIQNLIALLIFVTLIIVDSIVEKEFLSSIGITIVILYSFLWILWNIRMLFVAQIVQIKRDKYNMKDIVKESTTIVKHNIKIVSYTLGMQILFLSIFVFIIIKGNYNKAVTSITSVFSMVVYWAAILIYTKVFIEYSKKKYGIKNELTPAST
jgi:hypothetical protein